MARVLILLLLLISVLLAEMTSEMMTQKLLMEVTKFDEMMKAWSIRIDDMTIQPLTWNCTDGDDDRHQKLLAIVSNWLVMKLVMMAVLLLMLGQYCWWPIHSRWPVIQWRYCCWWWRWSCCWYSLLLTDDRYCPDWWWWYCWSDPFIVVIDLLFIGHRWPIHYSSDQTNLTMIEILIIQYWRLMTGDCCIIQ